MTKPLLPPLKKEKNKSHDQVSFDQIVSVLKRQSGTDFSLYKKNTLYRRIERRMLLHHFKKLPAYLNYLEKNSQEQTLLFNELLIGVTSFFRNPEVWIKLEKDILPTLITEHPRTLPLRAWISGCSTGEEAYTLAILLYEQIQELHPSKKGSIQIFATDLDQNAIEKARNGLFPLTIAADISKERLKRFFIKESHGYQICKEIRELVIFACQNLILDPPSQKSISSAVVIF